MAGYPWLVLSLVAIGVISFGLWVHHMFATGLPNLGLSFFSTSSMVIAIPSGIQIFSALATLWYGKVNFKTPLLYILGFIFTFVIGGISGVMVASVPLDWQVHDTYFVVAHFHYVLVGGALFPLLAGVYYWFPKLTGRLLDEGLGQVNFWLTFIGFHVAFFPMHISGLRGMPRRVYTYLAGVGLDELNLISTIGAFILALGFLLLIVNVLHSLRRGKVAGDNPWQAGTLEWATTSPPPHYNFEPLPVVRSRQPLWQQPAERTGYAFQSELDRRETLGTSFVAATPEMCVPLPTNTIVPFLTAVVVAVLIMSMIFSFTLFLVACGLLFLMLTIWHWPSAKERAMAWVQAGPPHALPISTVVRRHGSYPPYFYGIILLIVIEGVEFAALLASYYYLRAGTAQWPPPGTAAPSLWLPTLNLLILLLSAIPAYVADQAIQRDDQRTLRVGYLVNLLLGLLFLGLQVVQYSGTTFSWQTNAYGSIVWTLVGFHFLFVAAALLETVIILIWAYQGYFNAQRNTAVQIDGLNWYFSVAIWIPIYLTLYWAPYVF